MQKCYILRTHISFKRYRWADWEGGQQINCFSRRTPISQPPVSYFCILKRTCSFCTTEVQTGQDVVSKDSKYEPVFCRSLLLILLLWVQEEVEGRWDGFTLSTGAGCIQVRRNRDFTSVLLLQLDVFSVESGRCSGTKQEETLFKRVEMPQPSQILYTSQYINSRRWETTVLCLRFL